MNKKTAGLIISGILTGLVILSIIPCVYAGDMNAGIILADDRGRVLYTQNKEKSFVPASTLKILTSLAAIHILGEDYHFPTHYDYDATSKNLYIKGYGDPLLTSEVIEDLSQDIILKAKIKEIHHFIIDPSYYANPINIPGKGDSLNPYDAPVGALCANFNTINFQWDRDKKCFISGEPQTPLLDFFHEDIRKTNLRQGRIILSQQQSDLYPGLLLKHFLEKKIPVTGSVRVETFALKNTAPHVFQSPHELKTIVQSLLQYSNNFIANQLLLSMGAKLFGEPATLEKGVRAVQEFSYQEMNLSALKIHEGSGLSRGNRISPNEMLRILIKFMPYHGLLKHEENEFFKTGSLTGVRTRAGYLSGKDKRLYPYIILVNEENMGYEVILTRLKNMVNQLKDE
jgi:D-alanyl-D-alanine carboxypeptidase/D-alanyl-D-alanine-endopeptidase (penicillin-binding protein 4)